MERRESHTSRHIGKTSQQNEREKEKSAQHRVLDCLFWIMTVENSSRDFFVEPHHKEGSPIFLESGLYFPPPRPLFFCVYFNYSPHFASKLHTPPRYTYHTQITPPSFLQHSINLCVLSPFSLSFSVSIPPLFRKLGEQQEQHTN